MISERNCLQWPQSRRDPRHRPSWAAPNLFCRFGFAGEKMRFFVKSCFGKPWRGGRSKERSEEHTSELQSLMRLPYAVVCLTKKHTITNSQLQSLLINKQ